MGPHPPDDRTADVLAERLETLAGWLGELDARVRATELATGDEKTAKELRKAIEALAKHDPKALEKLRDHVDVLTDRVATLAGTVATATASLAGKDGELAALRRELAEVASRTASIAVALPAAAAVRPGELDEIRRLLSELRSERASQPSEKRLSAVEDKLALLGERLDTISGTVSTATSTIAGREGEITALRRQLAEDGARLGAAVAELRSAIDPAPTQQVRAAVEAVSARVSALEQEARGKLVAVGVDVDGLAARLAGVDASLATLRSELTALAQHVEALADVAARPRDAESVDQMEAESLVARFEAGAAKVDSLVRDLQEALATRPQGDTEALPETLAALERRLDSLAEAVAGSSAADATDRLQAVVDGLRMRLASTERELAALTGSHSVLARLDALERDAARAPGDDLLPVAGDGRLRVEMRALELRLEHAEAEARESRDAVLAQLERLASRIESRLRRLETERGLDASPEQYGHGSSEGQVVAIRSGES